MQRSSSSATRGRTPQQQQHEDPYAEIISNAVATGRRYRKTTANLGEENGGPWIRAATTADQNRLALTERTPGTNINHPGSLVRKSSSSARKSSSHHHHSRRGGGFLLGQHHKIEEDENQYHDQVNVPHDTPGLSHHQQQLLFAEKARKDTYRHGHRLATAGSTHPLFD